MLCWICYFEFVIFSLFNVSLYSMANYGVGVVRVSNMSMCLSVRAMIWRNGKFIWKKVPTIPQFHW